MTESELCQMLEGRAESTRSYIRRRIPSRVRRLVSVDDIMQESWISAFRYSDSFIAESPTAFDRWFITIVRSRILNAVRYANQGMRSVGRVQESAARSNSYLNLLARIKDPRRTASSLCAGLEVIQAVRSAISALPEDYRNAITMHHIDGRSHAEIAVTMNKSKAAVNSLLYRGLLKLKDQIGTGVCPVDEKRSS